MAQASASYSSSGDDSDLDDVPLFHPSLSQQQGTSTSRAPPGLSLHAPTPTSARPGLTLPTSQQLAGGDTQDTAASRRGPGLSLNLPLGSALHAAAGGPQSPAEASSLPSATTLQRAGPSIQTHADSLATPSPALEPLPSSRTARSPIPILQLPGSAAEPAPGSSYPASPALQPPTATSPQHGAASSDQTGPGRAVPALASKPNLPKLALAASSPRAADDATSPPPTYRARGSLYSPQSSPMLGSHAPSPQQHEDLGEEEAEYSSSSTAGDTLSSRGHTPAGGTLTSGDMQGSSEGAGGDEQHGPGTVFEVSLLSHAFCRVNVAPASPQHTQHANSSSSSGSQQQGVQEAVPAALQRMALQQVGQALGVAPHHLQLFEVVALPSTGGLQASAAAATAGGPRRLAVYLSTNSFSLSSLEETLARNKQLEELQKQQLEVMAGLHRDHHTLAMKNSDLQDTVAQLRVAAAHQEAELKTSQATNTQLWQEVQLLRDKLREADEQRQQLKGIIQDLGRDMHATLQGLGQAEGPPPAAPHSQ